MADFINDLGLNLFEDTDNNEDKNLTVTDLCNCIDKKVSNIRGVKVEGEISNWNSSQNQNSSKPIFFVLKDKKSQINVFISRWLLTSLNSNKYNSIQDGTKVIVRGDVQFYGPLGRLSLKASYLDLLDGVGDLYLEFLRVKELLDRKGLFSASHKLSLPQFIKNVGVITSLDGQAVKDIIRTIRRRNPFINIYVFDAKVQGKDAPRSLMQALYTANGYSFLDVLIVGRGGGSLEDLNCFNDQTWAEYLRTTRIPVVSGVGHEGNTTITDLVADVRASTPTAAAELVSVDITDKIRAFNSNKKRIVSVLQNSINNYQQDLKLIDTRLYNATMNALRDNYERLNNLESRLKEQSPINVLERQRNLLNTCQYRLEQTIWNIFQPKREDLYKLDRALYEAFTQLINVRYQQLDQLKARLSQCAHNYTAHYQRLLQLRQRLSLCSPLHQIASMNNSLQQARIALENIVGNRINNYFMQISKYAAILDAHSPLKVLARGYSITTDANNKLVKANTVQTGDRIKTRVSDGEIISVVEQVNKK